MTLQGEAWLTSRQKRFIDLGTVATIAPIAVPIVAVGAGSVALSELVNPLFIQDRIGQDEPIRIPKLRTLKGAPDSQASTTGYIHDRATKVGSVLRAAHIDEIPQAAHILSGTMSVVGPRPLVADDYTRTLDSLGPKEQAYWLRARKSSKPGVVDSYSIRQHEPGYKLDVAERALTEIEDFHAASRKHDTSILIRGAVLTMAAFLNLDVTERQGHPQTVQLLAELALAQGVEVTEDDRLYWSACLTMGRELDTLVDEKGVQDVRQQYVDLRSGTPLNDMSKAEALQFATIYDSQSRERQDVLDTAPQITQFAQLKHDARNPLEVAEAILSEADFYGNMLGLDDTDRFRITRFNRWLVQFSRAAYILDALVDNKKDFAKGLISYQPDLALQTNLMKHTLRENRKLLQTGNYKIPAILLRQGIAKFMRKIITER